MEEFEQSGMDPLTVSLYQMDLDRAQFLLRSYLRIRLQKVLNYVLYSLFLLLRLGFSLNLYTSKKRKKVRKLIISNMLLWSVFCIP